MMLQTDDESDVCLQPFSKSITFVHVSLQIELNMLELPTENSMLPLGVVKIASSSKHTYKTLKSGYSCLRAALIRYLTSKTNK